MDADIVIVGGGIAGCASAAALADEERRVLILEARQALKPRFAGELIHPTGATVLAALNVLPALHSAGGTDIEGFAVLKPMAQVHTLLPYREIQGARPSGFAIEHRTLVECVRLAATRRPGVELRLDEQVHELLRDSSGRVTGVKTNNGTVKARLILGCDGRNSKVRTLLGVPSQSRLLSFSAGVLLPGTAHELPSPGFGHIVLGAWGPILLYPISANGFSGDVRCCLDVSQANAKQLARTSEILHRHYAPFFPAPLRSHLLDALKEQPLQIVANEVVRTGAVVTDGAALIGDAGGCSHPLTAAGITVSLVDAQRIGRLLKPLGRLRDRALLDAALLQYQRERLRFVRVRELLADALYEVFRADEPGTRSIQAGIFRYWQSGPQSRARSMAFLSAADSNPWRFLREYLRVVASAAAATVLDHGEQLGQYDSWRDRGRMLMGLGKKSMEKAHQVLGILMEHGLRFGSSASEQQY